MGHPHQLAVDLFGVVHALQYPLGGVGLDGNVTKFQQRCLQALNVVVNGLDFVEADFVDLTVEEAFLADVDEALVRNNRDAVVPADPVVKPVGRHQQERDEREFDEYRVKRPVENEIERHDTEGQGQQAKDERLAHYYRVLTEHQRDGFVGVLARKLGGRFGGGGSFTHRIILADKHKFTVRQRFGIKNYFTFVG